MAERKSTKGGRKKKADVIDVGESPATESADAEAEEDSEKEAESEDVLVTDLAAAAETIDVSGEEVDVADADEVREPKVSTRGGSLARRDPMAAYMSETR